MSYLIKSMPLTLACLLITNCVHTQNPQQRNTAAQNYATAFPDPGLHNPRLRFHTGAVVNNAPEISSILPQIENFDASEWYVTQWRRPSFIQPNIMRPDPEVDPILGRSLYYFPSQDRKTYLKIFKNKNYVYELYTQGGELSNFGGTNLFLSSNALSPEVTFEKFVDYSVDMKFSKARIQYNTPQAKQTGAVMSQLFTGFILQFTDKKDPKNLPTTLFMQLYHNNTSFPNSEYRGCYRHDSNMEIVYGNVLPSDPRLDFKATSRAPTAMNFNINQYLCAMIRKGFNCNDNGKQYKFDFPESAKDFRNWKITSMYVGLETQDTDLRRESKNNQPQGFVEAAVQISNLQVIKSESKSFDYYRDCAN